MFRAEGNILHPNNSKFSPNISDTINDQQKSSVEGDILLSQVTKPVVNPTTSVFQNKQGKIPIPI